MFQFRRFPSYTYGFSIRYTNMTSCGLLHSEIHGSMPTYGSPWLIAVSRVLHRLLVPRHSPCALCSLTMCSLLGIRNEFVVNILLAKNKLFKLFRFFEIAVITLNNYFGSLDLDNNSLVNNSFLAFLSASLYSVFKVHLGFLPVVGLSGLEPPTSRLSGGRSNLLSYKPISRYAALFHFSLWWR